MNSKAELKQQLILDATLNLIAENDPESLSVGKIAEATGLSRPAIYQYFSSKEDIFAELIINDLADLSNELDRLLGSIDDCMEQVRVWLHYSLAHLSGTDHKLVRKISVSNLPEEKRGMVGSMHGYIMMSLMSPLTNLGVEDPSSMGQHIFSAVSATADRIDEGWDYTQQAGSLEKFVMAGIEADVNNLSC